MSIQRGRISSGEALILRSAVQSIADSTTKAVLIKQLDRLTKVMRDGKEVMLDETTWFRLGLIPRRLRLQGVPSEFVLAYVSFRNERRAGRSTIYVVNGRLFSIVFKDSKDVELDAMKVSDIAVAEGEAPWRGEKSLDEQIQAAGIKLPESWIKLLKGHGGTLPVDMMRTVAGISPVIINGKDLSIIADSGPFVGLCDGDTFYVYQAEDEELSGPMAINSMIEKLMRESQCSRSF